MVLQKTVPCQTPTKDRENREHKIYVYLNHSFCFSELCGHMEKAIMFLYLTETNEKPINHCSSNSQTQQLLIISSQNTPLTSKGFFLSGTSEQCAIKKAQVTPRKEIKIIEQLLSKNALNEVVILWKKIAYYSMYSRILNCADLIG